MKLVFDALYNNTGFRPLPVDMLLYAVWKSVIYFNNLDKAER